MHAVDTMSPWTATRINSANYCGMRWFLEYVAHAPKKKFSFFEKGKLLHDMIDNFWIRLGDKYKTAQEFANYAQRLWSRVMIMSEKSDTPINWRYENEKWVIRDQMKNIGLKLFDKLMTEGKPLFSELSFDVLFEGIRYRGRLDEIRIRDGMPVIRDYKSGRPFDSVIKLEFDPQPTFYYIGALGLAKTNPQFAEMLGLEKEIDSFMTPERVFPEKLKFEYTMLEDENLATHPTSRDDIRYRQLVDMINGIRSRYVHNSIYPEYGRKCDFCDVKQACMSRNSHTSVIEENGQLLLSVESPRPEPEGNGFFGVRNSNIPGIGINNPILEEQTKMRLRASPKKKFLHN